MENQISIGNQNTQQVEQNPPTQSVVLTEKPKINYLLILGVVLTCFLVFGFGGYYLGKQSLKVTDEFKQIQSPPSPVITGGNTISNLKTYKIPQYGIEFDYPQNYTISTRSDCGLLLINNQTECLVSLTLNSTNDNYTPKANFWFLKGINSVDIGGQTSSIIFDSQKRAWVVNYSDFTEVLPLWDKTKSGKEIIRSVNGGSHSSSYYYIIPKYDNDEVAIFSIPKSYRLRCDSFVNDKPKETDCNNFYQSVIEQYNNGEITDDTWLPENYLRAIYSEAENIVKSYREIVK